MHCCSLFVPPPPICGPRSYFGCGPMPFFGCGPFIPFGGCFHPGNAMMFGLGAGLGCAAGNLVGGLINKLC